MVRVCSTRNLPIPQGMQRSDFYGGWQSVGERSQEPAKELEVPKIGKGRSILKRKARRKK